MILTREVLLNRTLRGPLSGHLCSKLQYWPLAMVYGEVPSRLRRPLYGNLSRSIEEGMHDHTKYD